ncbi:hypothetical protein ONS96_011370 [Cadophora gregata f. sp. sojae]|nr:hypothetical protein ONS96_011370 [Cadophora gregata f. sp. sojae]
MDRESVDIPLDQSLLSRDSEDAADYSADDGFLDVDKATLSQFSIFMLTTGLGGLQLIFATEYSCGTPYLLSLGLTKSAVSLIWISGPLAGAVVQPYCGFLSDRCRHSWGPRRPYIVAGSFSAIVSLLFFAWSADIVRILLEYLPSQVFENTEVVFYATTTFAVFWLSVLNVAIQLIQGGLRSLIAENCPSNQQEQANAWASRVIQAGNVFGYSTNFVNLPHFLPWVGQTQLQALAAITSCTLVATTISSCWSVQEKVLSSDEITVVKSHSPLSHFKQHFKLRRVSPQGFDVFLKYNFWSGSPGLLFICISRHILGRCVSKTSSWTPLQLPI